MNIQDLLTFAIEAIFNCFCAFIFLDLFIRCTAPFAVPPMPKIEKRLPQTLEELEPDGVYNFGLALALSDPD
ncbi:hypothetical protein G7B40_040375 [Aetokthonos hydrillicola Thurmond2011]|jgi:hypothetical protein|uniref:Uncharacterized protein n=1 Tax=Aetokthonos hydrillicola Thurmond2011 TaxID=2712845 RepID=A0AAP5IFR1_9CYAN|nr:hypothetical protein [Aetokthonos hydrillicola]MBO3463673.1 hypothetical protein [Aetokthonos hydrillicola CCALA 1050]MDR9900745.1 hypothetical protein [Aetokthonos hydrillicola Thurmond2011]